MRRDRASIAASRRSLRSPGLPLERKVATNGMADAGDVLGAKASGKEPAIRPLYVVDLRRELVFGRAPVIHDEDARSHHLGDVPKRLSVSVHRSDDCAAGVTAQH